MKKMIYAAAAGALSLATVSTLFAQQERLEGNGHIITREVSVQPFTALDASGVYELKLSQGATESVKIEADENLQELFTVTNKGSELVIEMKTPKLKNLNLKNKLRVYVQFKNLASLHLHTVGNVTSANPLQFDGLELKNASVGNVDLELKATSLTLDNASVGNITLQGKADEAVMKNSGVGNLKAGDFVVQTLEIDNSGVGNADVNAARGISVHDSFLGKVRNRGAATRKGKKEVI